MKKRLSVVVLCLLMVSFAKAGDGLLDFGLKAGLNFPSLNAQDGAPTLNNKTGFHAGGIVRVNIPLISVHGEVLYSQTGFETPDSEDVKNANLDIPITAHLSLLKILSIHVGPQFTYLVSSKISGDDIKEQVDNSTFNFVAGAGVSLGSLEVTGRFVFPSGFEYNEVGEAAKEYKNSNIQLSVGYWF